MYAGWGLRFGINGPIHGGAGYSLLRLFALGEQGTWYDPSDLTTLFQDAAGTTPVTASGQPVGLVLDKSKGLVRGVELVTNGTFDTGTSGWTAAVGSISTEAGALVVTNTTAAEASAITGSVVAGRWYEATLTVTQASNAGAITIGGSRIGLGGIGVKHILLSATVSSDIRIATNSAVLGHTVKIDNISVRELPGNHASQATAASRPVLVRQPATGVRNLLTSTEMFTDAAWTKAATTISANVVTSPIGDLTADKLVETAAAAVHQVSQAIQATLGQTYTFSVFAKAGERQYLTFNGTSAAFGAQDFAIYDLQGGTVTQVGSSGTASITSVGGGWWRCSRTVAAISTVSAQGFFGLANSATAGRAPSYPGDGTSGMYIWGAQFETGSTATAYQKVVAATEVTEAGVPDTWALKFDGVDDFLVTGNIDFTATDKMSVFAGVRKLNDTAFQTIAELSTNSDSMNGAFYLGASTLVGDASRRTWAANLRGTQAMIGGASVYAAPDTRVISVSMDISGAASANEMQMRINSVSQTLGYSAANAGTGNYGNYPLYIGRRGGTTLPFNGHIYGLVIRGALTDATSITSVERYLAAKTGVVL